MVTSKNKEVNKPIVKPINLVPFEKAIKENGLAHFTYDANGKLTGAVIVKS